ncbi:unnamed protein product [Merluccius merluccius]
MFRHKNKTSGWPPPGAGPWGGLQGPPYSWDSMNTPRDPRDYHSNQVSQSSSLEEVRLDGMPPAPRLVEMRRDPVLGFGFVAGSEKPVVVRSVTPGGPSEGKLIAGDEIIMINDEAVSSAPRERVIDLVRSCKESIMLTVVQPYPSPKSAFISAAKKAKLKSNPVKVRFAEEVIINGQVPNSVKDNSLLFMPNVLKVYLENGQTKSFRFDCSTSIKEVILTLQEKLSIKSIEHFSLMLEQRREGGACRLLLLHEQEMLVQVTRRPGADKMKCFFRLSFVPRDPVELLRRDAVAFEYLYVQCCNDVVLERFGAELKYDAALRLAALQMYIITMTTRQSQKVSLKYILKEWGLPLFLPPAVMASMKEKNIRKALTHILKTNHNLVPPGKKLTVLQAKVHYLRFLSELQLYGGREFKSILLQGEKQTEVVLLVGPRYGISHVINARTNLVALLADFSHVNRIEILTEDDTNVRLELHVLDVRPITLIMESSDAMNLACLTAGYYRLLVDSRRSIFNMAHCNSMGLEDASHDRILEWPYSTSLGDCEEEPPPGDGDADVYSHHSDYNANNGQRGNASVSPYFHNDAQRPDGGGGGGGGGDDDSGGDPGGRRSPLPPPLPPSTRHKPQDSPRSAKVSFIFGGDPPRDARGNAAGGYERALESPDAPALQPPYLRRNVDFGSSQDGMPFHYDGGGGGGGPHVYSNIGGEEGNEEPLLRDLCYADTTDDAEDEDDASCEEDSTGGGGTPVNDVAGNGNRVPNCLDLTTAQGGLAAAVAGKTTFLALSGSADDIIDLTALPPPEGDDAVAVDDDDEDTLLETLNLAIAAPPPGFRDSSDEDAGAPEGRPLSTPDNDDIIPVSSIDAVATGGEGSRGGVERRLDNAVANTLQALEALSVAEQRPPPRPHAPGVRTSRVFSPESSSDSGNETNSSEMTEISELAAAHRLSESHMRLLVATREGYQPLLEEKTEFPISPGAGETLPQQKQQPRSPSRRLLPPPAVPPRRSPPLDAAAAALGPDGLRAGAQARNGSSATLQRPSSVTPGGKHQRKSGDSGGKYNTFSTRDGHWGSVGGGSGGLLELDPGFTEEQGKSHQRRQNSLMAENLAADGLGINSHHGLPRPPPSAADHSSDGGEFGAARGATDDGASAIVEQDERLVVASLLSPAKKQQLRSAGSDHGADAPSDHPPVSRQQSVARLCEYHLAKRISNLQGEAHSSLQGSLCSSLDAGGGSTNSSAGGTPADSPLGPAALESKHQQQQQQQQHHHHHHQQHLQRHPLSSSSSSLLRAANYEESKSAGVPQGQNKELHPHADPAMLRKMLPNIHPPVAAGGSEPARPSSATPSKHKETSGTASRRFQNDLHAKQQAYLRGLNQQEGSQAYRQLINYLTVSQMHQGGKLHSAGMGGAAKRDGRRYVTSGNPQLVEMVKNRGNHTIARCPCNSSSSSAAPFPFVGPNSANPTFPRPYHSATLPTKLVRSPDMHAHRPRDSVEVRRPGIERRSSLSGLEGELEPAPTDPERFASQCGREGAGRERGCGREGGGSSANRPPSRSRSQPSGGGSEGWFESDARAKHAARQTPRSLPNDALCFSAAPSLAGQRAELSTLPLGGRGDQPSSAFTRQASAGPRACVVSPSAVQRSIPPPPPPPPPPVTSPQPMQANNCGSNSGSLPRQDSLLALNPMQYWPNQNHVQPVGPRTLRQADPFHGGLRRGRELRRSSSNTTAGSGSAEALFEKPVRSHSQQPLAEAKAPHRRPVRKRLSKSYSQGSVCSQTTCWSMGSRGGGGGGRRASVAFPLQKDGKHAKGSQKLDASPWRCNGPFSYCFFKRKSEGEEDEVEWEGQRQSRGTGDYDAAGGGAVAAANATYCGSGLDAAAAGEQLYGEVLDNMSFGDRLARINALKDRVYVSPGGFADVRRDASELIALVRSGVGRGDRGGPPSAPPPPVQDLSRYKQLLAVESKELGRACRRAAQAHGSAEEMLLAVTCSFQVLCCLCEACMCLVRGLGGAAAGAHQQQREVVAKVDEVVMNYICLLRAAEAAAVGAPGEHSVKALVRHSSTMTAIANALTRSLKMLLSK